jgi:hypothetical protein
MSPQNPAIDPRRTALLIMDYQPAVLGGLSDHDQLQTFASGAIDLARQAGITVVYVRVAFADEDYKRVPEANKMLAGVARSRALHHEAPETQIYGRLEPQPGDIVVRKTRIGHSRPRTSNSSSKTAGSPLSSSPGSAPAASSCQPSAKPPTATIRSTSSPTPAPTVTRTFTPSSPRKSCPCRRTSSPSPTSPA